MPTYRFYFIELDGHIAEPPTVADFPNDHLAVESAQAILDRKVIEVWKLARVVARLEPKHT